MDTVSFLLYVLWYVLQIWHYNAFYFEMKLFAMKFIIYFTIPWHQPVPRQLLGGAAERLGQDYCSQIDSLGSGLEKGCFGNYVRKMSNISRAIWVGQTIKAKRYLAVSCDVISLWCEVVPVTAHRPGWQKCVSYRKAQ